MLNENFLISSKNVAIDVKEFLEGSENVLLIIGLSGSGKSTLGKKLAKDYNCNYISTDDLWEKYKIADIKDPEERSKVYKNLYTDILMQKKKTIIEGVHYITYYKLYNNQKDRMDLLLSKPVIFLGTSLLKSTYRAAKRDEFKGDDSFYKIFKDRLNWQMDKKMDQWMNKYKKEKMSMSKDIAYF